MNAARQSISLARKAPISVMMSTMSPGTRYQVLVFAALNHMRCSTVTRPAEGAAAPAAPPRSAWRRAACASAPLT